jgi:pilus retraction protein PilT
LAGENRSPEDEFSFADVADSLRIGPRGASTPAPTPVRQAPPTPGPVAPGPAAPARPNPVAPAGATPPAPARPAAQSTSSAPTADTTPPALSSTGLSPRHQLEAWLALMVKSGASDLILRAGGRPSHRTDGKIGFFPGRVPTAGALLEVLEGIIGKDRMETWRVNGSADAALHLDGLGRFRMNAYRQMGDPAVVLRRISQKAPNLDNLELPSENLKKLSMRKRGLVLVTGIAGSGKSTTLAAMIQHMNETVERHVVTLEDPVELLFTEQNCVISQREVGTDCTTFKDGLRHALRQSPDVILIGEMRDAETVISALDATETGHLVLSTLHTVNAAQTVERILSFFSANQHAQVRQRMADNLAGVLSQRLVQRAGGKGMIPAFELMVSTPHIRELLQEGKTSEMARVIEQGTERGLISFNMCLRRLVQEHKVELNDALAASDRPEELVLALRGITGSSVRVETNQANAPRAATGPDGLRMAKRE